MQTLLRGALLSVNAVRTRFLPARCVCYSSLAAKAELARAFFWRLKANGHVIVVITSYQEFPGRIDNPYDDRHTTPQDRVIHEAVDGYLHCFRRVPPLGRTPNPRVFHHLQGMTEVPGSLSERIQTCCAGSRTGSFLRASRASSSARATSMIQTAKMEVLSHTSGYTPLSFVTVGLRIMIMVVFLSVDLLRGRASG